MTARTAQDDPFRAVHGARRRRAALSSLVGGVATAALFAGVWIVPAVAVEEY